MAFPATNASAAYSACYYGSPPGATVINPTLVAGYFWSASDTYYLHDVTLEADIFQNQSLVAEQTVYETPWFSYEEDSIAVWISNVGVYANYRVAGQFDIHIYDWFSFQTAHFYESCTTDTRPLVPQ
jgi:hypothetical protein